MTRDSSSPKGPERGSRLRKQRELSGGVVRAMCWDRHTAVRENARLSAALSAPRSDSRRAPPEAAWPAPPTHAPLRGVGPSLFDAAACLRRKKCEKKCQEAAHRTHRCRSQRQARDC